MLTNYQIDIASISLQVVGAWVCAVQVLRAYKKNPIQNLRMKWSGKDSIIEYTNDFQRFTKFMKVVFIIGLILISVGLLLPLTKNQGNQMPNDNPTKNSNTNPN
jgi:hypothetical protein